MESLRSFGYDLPTAIADLVDNSISAGARRVWIGFAWDGSNSTITLRDDGMGMDEKELVAAMRLGSRSPLEIREDGDLGRFGLGLKTASFSQCRLLAVRTKKDGEGATCRCWDLDYVAQCDSWRLLHHAPDSVQMLLDALDLTESGTVVVWQNLDRLVGDCSVDDEEAKRHFYRLAEQVETHLGMTFHDYLFGNGAIQVSINGRKIARWDAFKSEHPATQQLPVDPIDCGNYSITVSPFVLPHHTRVTPDEWNQAGGVRGWNSHQGFYIFRNNRLLVSGGWLGLGFSQEDHFKLARIRIDIPNGADAAWQLDVKKSTAKIPVELHSRLKRIASLTREHAVRVYRHRGAKLLSANGAQRIQLWEQRTRRGKIVYTLNEEHPLIRSVLVSSKAPRSVKALLRLIRETVPTPLISIVNAEKPLNQASPFEGTKTTQIQAVMREVYQALIDAGQSPKQAKLQLGMMDGFNRFLELIETLDGDNQNTFGAEVFNEEGDFE